MDLALRESEGAAPPSPNVAAADDAWARADAAGARVENAQREADELRARPGRLTPEDLERRRRGVGLAILLAAVVAGAGVARAEDAPRVVEYWDELPTAQDLDRVAAGQGFVVVLSPAEWDLAIRTAEAAKAERQALEERTCEALELRAEADRLRDELARLQGAVHAAEIDGLRWKVRALEPKHRLRWFLIGAVTKDVIDEALQATR